MNQEANVILHLIISFFISLHILPLFYLHLVCEDLSTDEESLNDTAAAGKDHPAGGLDHKITSS